MAQVKTRQQYYVDVTMQEILQSFSRLTEYERNIVLPLLEGTAFHSNTTFSVNFTNEREAKEFLSHVLGEKLETIHVQSYTDYNTVYDVKVDLNTMRVVSCTCPDYVNRSQYNKAHVCKHMSRVANSLTSYLVGNHLTKGANR